MKWYMLARHSNTASFTAQFCATLWYTIISRAMHVQLASPFSCEALTQYEVVGIKVSAFLTSKIVHFLLAGPSSLLPFCLGNQECNSRQCCVLWTGCTHALSNLILSTL